MDEFLDTPALVDHSPIITDEMRDHAKLIELVEQQDEVPCQVWPDAYFPEHGDNGSTVIWAKNQCLDCPALKLCGDYGLKHQPYHGIWGGLTVMDRRRINKLAGVKLFTPSSQGLG